MLLDRVLAMSGGSDLPEITAIDGSHIADQIDAMPDDAPQFQAGDYECVAPPFSTFFIEATKRVGGIWYQRGLMFDTGRVGEQPSSLNWTEHRQVDGAFWFMEATAFLWSQERGIVGAPGFAALYLDRNGWLLEDMTKIAIMTSGRLQALALGSAPLPVIAKNLPFALMTLRAMHRKAPIERVRPTRQQRRAARRDGHERPLVDHYVIRVDPRRPRRVADIGTPPAEGEVRSRRAPDFVREHYKYYHPDRPLFGKFSGLVRIPARSKKSGATRTYIVQDDVVQDS